MNHPTDTTGNPLRRLASRRMLCFWAVVLLHLCVALALKGGAGIDIECGAEWSTWDWFWQTLPAESLRTDLARSLWNLHAQPPFYNLWGALFIRLFHPHYLQCMQYANILLGALLSGMLYVLLYRFTGGAVFSLVTAAVLALNPSLFLYEAYILYTLLTAFLVVLILFLLSLFSSSRRPAWAYACVAAANVLILTRSAFHLVILLGVIGVLCILARTQWRRVLAVSVLISLVSVGWYGKNWVKFGFFGASSWGGLGLWHIASVTYPPTELRALADQGVIDPMMVQLRPFARPVLYVPHGYTAVSDVDVLSRNDFNNINIPAISAAYGRNAWRLIRHAPGRYLRTIDIAYRGFNFPSSRFSHMRVNAAKIATYETVSSQWIQGGALGGRLGKESFGSFSYFLLPAALLFYLVVPVWRCGVSARKWAEYLRSDAAMFAAALMILYTTAIACTLEIGENDRFRFLIEQVFWAFVAGVAYRYVTGRRGPPVAA